MSTAEAKTKFYKFTASAAGESVLEIFGDISTWWGNSLESLAWDLYGRTGPLRVLLNSPGGDLLQGVAMGNMLKAYPGAVTVEIIGFCASAATLIAAGANKVKIHTGAFYMIHNPAVISEGDAAQLQKDVETLQKMETEVAALYVAEMKKRGKMGGMSDEEAMNKVKEWMSAETWFTSSEAVEYGFADEVVTTAEAVTDNDTYNATQSRIYAKFKNAPVTAANNTAMSKDNKGFLAALGDLVKKYTASAETTETTEGTTTTTETAKTATELTAEQMAEQLAAQGYTVTAPAPAAAPAAPEAPAAAPAAPEAPAVEMYTQEQVTALVEQALKASTAAKPTAKGDGGSTAPANPAEPLKKKLAAALSPVAKAIKK